MALQLSIPNKFGSTAFGNGYVHLRKIDLDAIDKRGTLTLRFWSDPATRADATKSELGNLNISIGSTEILNSSNQSVDQIKYEDVAFKTQTECYLKLKTLKVNFEGNILNLATAVDV